MIEKVKIPIYRFEGKEPHEECILYDIIKEILVARWTKSNTPCIVWLTHSIQGTILQVGLTKSLAVSAPMMIVKLLK
ncbi:hypothetical protein ZWY2020_054292 [Hordeum vulgare]|nr:hypothetical protein ZWY2020_054292 [Hordeum vulgare]